MMSKLMNQIGDWNPQLLRELKGRLKTRNILLAITISLLGQFLLFMSLQTQIPHVTNYLYSYSHKYCTGKFQHTERECIYDEFGNLIINWQLWSFDVFTWLSIIGSFTLLVAGTYLLISDLATEERRDTLNFIRLSPQTPQSILWGKIIGVPILLYLAVFLAFPLHLWLGLNAKIPLSMIFSFYAVVIAASVLYYSGALLFGLVGSWLGSFQSWLGSGALLGVLILTKQAFADMIYTVSPLILLKLINPYYLIPSPDKNSLAPTAISQLSNFYWFNLPLGSSFVMTACWVVFIYLIGTYFIWKSLHRCYRDPQATMLSKKQSYVLTTSFAIITIGCANWQKLFSIKPYPSFSMTENLLFLMFVNLWLFLYLIAALNPHRQALQDWTRYLHIYSSQKLGSTNLIKDLIWGEKSPGVLAIAINAIIAIVGLSLVVFLSQSNATNKISALIALGFGGSLAVIYATLAQLLLFMKNEQRLFWSAGIVGAVIVLPPIVLSILLSNPSKHSLAWLFTVAAPLVALYPSGNYLSSMAALLAILGHFSILGLLATQLTRQLKKSGESATKALLAGN